MARNLSAALLIAMISLIAVCWLPVAVSQDDGSGSSRSAPSRATRPQTPNEFYSAFWGFIVKRGAAYNTWKVLSRGKVEDGIENPHSSISKTYADKVAAENPLKLPTGSILVREDYDAEKSRTSISVMYRVENYDKDHGNWYWLKYLEDGSVMRDASGKTQAGKIASCAECHSKAKGNDFVFSNDALSHEDGKENDASADKTSQDSSKNAKDE